MNFKKIKNLRIEFNNTDAVNLNKVKNQIQQKFESSATANLDIGGKMIIKLQNGIYKQEAATVAEKRNLVGYKITS